MYVREKYVPVDFEYSRREIGRWKIRRWNELGKVERIGVKYKITKRDTN